MAPVVLYGWLCLHWEMTVHVLLYHSPLGGGDMPIGICNCSFPSIRQAISIIPSSLLNISYLLILFLWKTNSSGWRKEGMCSIDTLLLTCIYLSTFPWDIHMAWRAAFCVYYHWYCLPATCTHYYYYLFDDYTPFDMTTILTIIVCLYYILLLHYHGWHSLSNNLIVISLLLVLPFLPFFRWVHTCSVCWSDYYREEWGCCIVVGCHCVPTHQC